MSMEIPELAAICEALKNQIRLDQVRLEICLSRFKGCMGDRHPVSIVELPGWIDSCSKALTSPIPEDALRDHFKKQERLIIDQAAKIEELQSVKEGFLIVVDFLDSGSTDFVGLNKSCLEWKNKHEARFPKTKTTEDQMSIQINGVGTEHKDNTSLSYEEVVKLAGMDPERILTVAYRFNNGSDWTRSGILGKGQVLENVRCGTIFNVVDTSAA
jgi:hypothetical protein